MNRATLTEQNLYGASRLGIRRKDVRLYENGTSPFTIPDVQQNTLGNIAYEITNYLGNVNVVISDRKLWVPASSAFKAVVLSRTDYFPFGMEISSRTTNSDNYRFGYNGSDSYRKESDNETKGSGNSYTTEFRQYDPRLGRWLSLDPLMAQFPWQSPYCAFDNNPVYFTDPLGLAAEGGPGDKDKEAGTWTNPSSGAVYKYDKDADSWYNSNNEVTVTGQYKRTEGFKENSFYRLGSNGWEESSFMYTDAISGKDLGTYYSVVRFQLQAEREKENYYREEARKTEEYNEAVLEFNKQQNIFYLMYEISMLGSVKDVYDNVSNGNYKTAALIAVLELAPGELDDAYKATRKTTHTHHLIPNQTNRDYLKGLEGWNQNHSKNLIELPTPFHGSHYHYNKYVNNKIQNLIKKGKLTAENVVKIQNQLRRQIENLPKTLDDPKLNDVYRNKK